MLKKTVITCAISGSATSRKHTPAVPITPQEIADSALRAAEAGAAAVHLHVRDPVTGKASMALELYQEVVEHIRARNPELIINLTTGPGARFVPSEEDPKIAAPGTTLTLPEIRVSHIAAIKPDIATLDLNTMISREQVVINTPVDIRKMAAIIRAAGVTPELEIFDSGDLHLALALIAEGVLEGPGLYSLVLGVKFGFAPTPETVLYARNMLPPGAVWTAFGIGQHAFPMVAQAWLMGGHARVGLEDNIYLSKGRLASSNAELVEKAVEIITQLGGSVATAREARVQFGLERR